MNIEELHEVVGSALGGKVKKKPDAAAVAKRLRESAGRLPPTPGLSWPERTAESLKEVFALPTKREALGTVIPQTLLEMRQDPAKSAQEIAGGTIAGFGRLGTDAISAGGKLVSPVAPDTGEAIYQFGQRGGQSYDAVMQKLGLDPESNSAQMGQAAGSTLPAALAARTPAGAAGLPFLYMLSNIGAQEERSRRERGVGMSAGETAVSAGIGASESLPWTPKGTSSRAVNTLFRGLAEGGQETAAQVANAGVLDAPVTQKELLDALSLGTALGSGMEAFRSPPVRRGPPELPPRGGLNDNLPPGTAAPTPVESNGASDGARSSPSGALPAAPRGDHPPPQLGPEGYAGLGDAHRLRRWRELGFTGNPPAEWQPAPTAAEIAGQTPSRAPVPEAPAAPLALPAPQGPLPPSRQITHRRPQAHPSTGGADFYVEPNSADINDNLAARRHLESIRRQTAGAQKRLPPHMPIREIPVGEASKLPPTASPAGNLPTQTTPAPEQPPAQPKEKIPFAGVSSEGQWTLNEAMSKQYGKQVFDGFVPPGELQTDGETYQHRRQGQTETGDTGNLANVTQIDPSVLEPLVVHARINPETGKTEYFVADGHNRFAAVKRLGYNQHIRALILREADGWTADDARALGAARNFKQGTADEVDGAIALRNATPEQRADMEAGGSSSLARVRNARGLAGLTQAAFNRFLQLGEAVNGSHAAMISDATPNEKKQLAALEALADERPETTSQAAEIIEDAAALLEEQLVDTQEDMFGKKLTTDELKKERKVRDAAYRLLDEERRASVGVKRHGGRMEKQGIASKTKPGEAAKIAEENATLKQTIKANTRGNAAGPLRDEFKKIITDYTDSGETATNAQIKEAAERLIEVAKSFNMSGKQTGEISQAGNLPSRQEGLEMDPTKPPPGAPLPTAPEGGRGNDDPFFPDSDLPLQSARPAKTKMQELMEEHDKLARANVGRVPSSNLHEQASARMREIEQTLDMTAEEINESLQTILTHPANQPPPASNLPSKSKPEKTPENDINVHEIQGLLTEAEQIQKAERTYDGTYTEENERRLDAILKESLGLGRHIYLWNGENELDPVFKKSQFLHDKIRAIVREAQDARKALDERLAKARHEGMTKPAPIRLPEKTLSAAEQADRARRLEHWPKAEPKEGLFVLRDIIEDNWKLDDILPKWLSPSHVAINKGSILGGSGTSDMAYSKGPTIKATNHNNSSSNYRLKRLAQEHGLETQRGWGGDHQIIVFPSLEARRAFVQDILKRPAGELGKTGERVAGGATETKDPAPLRSDTGVRIPDASIGGANASEQQLRVRAEGMSMKELEKIAQGANNADRTIAREALEKQQGEHALRLEATRTHQEWDYAREAANKASLAEQKEADRFRYEEDGFPYIDRPAMWKDKKYVAAAEALAKAQEKMKIWAGKRDKAAAALEAHRAARDGETKGAVFKNPPTTLAERFKRFFGAASDIYERTNDEEHELKDTGLQQHKLAWNAAARSLGIIAGTDGDLYSSATGEWAYWLTSKIGLPPTTNQIDGIIKLLRSTPNFRVESEVALQDRQGILDDLQRLSGVLRPEDKKTIERVIKRLGNRPFPPLRMVEETSIEGALATYSAKEGVEISREGIDGQMPPSLTIPHEISHSVWRLMTNAERAEFLEIVRDNYYIGGQLDILALSGDAMPKGHQQGNATQDFNELFAWLSQRYLYQQHAPRSAKEKSFWQKMKRYIEAVWDFFTNKPVPQEFVPFFEQVFGAPTMTGALKQSVQDRLAFWRGETKAVEGGREMSQEAKDKRAAEQGFVVDDGWYHVTNEDFDRFDSGKTGIEERSKLGKGFYFSRKPDMNIRHHWKTKKMHVYLRYKNPLILDGNAMAMAKGAQVVKTLGLELDSAVGRAQKITDEAKRQGYDAIIYRYPKSQRGPFGKEEIVVFDSNQIRRTDADFDPARTDSSDLKAVLPFVNGKDGKVKWSLFGKPAERMPREDVWEALGTALEQSPEAQAIPKRLAKELGIGYYVSKTLPTDERGAPVLADMDFRGQRIRRRFAVPHGVSKANLFGATYDAISQVLANNVIGRASNRFEGKRPALADAIKYWIFNTDGATPEASNFLDENLTAREKRALDAAQASLREITDAIREQGGDLAVERALTNSPKFQSLGKMREGVMNGIGRAVNRVHQGLTNSFLGVQRAGEKTGGIEYADKLDAMRARFVLSPRALNETLMGGGAPVYNRADGTFLVGEDSISLMDVLAPANKLPIKEAEALVANLSAYLRRKDEVPVPKKKTEEGIEYYDRHDPVYRRQIESIERELDSNPHRETILQMEQGVRKFLDDHLRLLEQVGEIGPVTKAEWKAKHPYYLPGYHKNHEFVNSYLPRTRSAETKITGVEALALYSNFVLRKSYENSLLREVAKMAGMKGGGQFMQKVNNPRGEGFKLGNTGIDSNGAVLRVNNGDRVDVFQIDSNQKLLMDALDSLTPRERRNFIWRMATWLKNFQQTAIAAVPHFQGSVFLQEMPHNMLNTRHPSAYPRINPRGAFVSWNARRNPRRLRREERNLLLNGLPLGALTPLGDPGSILDPLARFDPHASNRPALSGKGAVEGAARFLETMRATEGVSRLPLAQERVRKGDSPLQASYAAMSSADFTKTGRSLPIQIASETIPFFNSAVAGFRAFSRNLLAEMPRIAAKKARGERLTADEAAAARNWLIASTIFGALGAMVLEEEENPLVESMRTADGDRYNYTVDLSDYGREMMEREGAIPKDLSLQEYEKIYDVTRYPGGWEAGTWGLLVGAHFKYATDKARGREDAGERYKENVARAIRKFGREWERVGEAAPLNLARRGLGFRDLPQPPGYPENRNLPPKFQHGRTALGTQAGQFMSRMTEGSFMENWMRAPNLEFFWANTLGVGAVDVVNDLVDDAFRGRFDLTSPEAAWESGKRLGARAFKGTTLPTERRFAEQAGEQLRETASGSKQSTENEAMWRHARRLIATKDDPEAAFNNLDPDLRLGATTGRAYSGAGSRIGSVRGALLLVNGAIEEGMRSDDWTQVGTGIDEMKDMERELQRTLAEYKGRRVPGIWQGSDGQTQLRAVVDGRDSAAVRLMQEETYERIGDLLDELELFILTQVKEEVGNELRLQ